MRYPPSYKRLYKCKLKIEIFKEVCRTGIDIAYIPRNRDSSGSYKPDDLKASQNNSVKFFAMQGPARCVHLAENGHAPSDDIEESENRTRKMAAS